MILLVAGTILFVSWDTDHHQQQAGGKISYDTIPGNREHKARDLDEIIAELDKIDLNIHLEKALKEVSESLKKIDAEKLKLEIERSVQEVDADRIKAEVARAMKDIDLAKIEREVKESIAKIDWEKIEEELERVKKIDLSGMEAELDKAREELERIGPRIEAELKKAGADIEKAKTEMKEYKSFVDALDADGKIDKKKGYSISHRDGKLEIDGREADNQTYRKHRDFLQKHKNFTLKKSGEDFRLEKD